MKIVDNKAYSPKIVVLGPPGCGKGTHSANLARLLRIPVYGAGELLREAAERKSKKAEKVKKILEAGRLVPNEITDELIKEKVRKSKKGVIIEGYPRALVALEMFKKYFQPDLVIFLNISKKEIMKRLGGRRVCVKCGKVYHTTFNKPRKSNFCDICGNKLARRHDETSKAIKERIKVFEKGMLPVIKWYKKQGLVLEINGNNRSIKDVSDELMRKMEDKLS